MPDLVQEYSSFTSSPLQAPMDVPCRSSKPTIVLPLFVLSPLYGIYLTPLDPHWRNWLPRRIHPLSSPVRPLIPAHHLSCSCYQLHCSSCSRFQGPPRTASSPPPRKLKCYLPFSETLRLRPGSFKARLFEPSSQFNFDYPRRLDRQLPRHSPLVYQRSYPWSS